MLRDHLIDAGTPSAKRKLAVRTSGDPDGVPIFLLHGSPGSRTGPVQRGGFLYRAGIWLITYDRPGYGGSTRLPERDVASAAGDVNKIIDFLEIQKRIGVMGRSGGGPHALACARFLPLKVKGVVAAACPMPHDTPDDVQDDNMGPVNRSIYGASQSESDLRMLESIRRTTEDPQDLINILKPDLVPSDLRFVDDPAMKRRLLNAYAKGLTAEAAMGWFDDVRAFRKPWGFALEDIQGVNVKYWQSTGDRFNPVEYSKELRRQTPGAVLEIQPGVGHFAAFEETPRLLAELRDNVDPAVGTPFRSKPEFGTYQNLSL